MSEISVNCQECKKAFDLDMALADEMKEFVCPNCQIKQVVHSETPYLEYKVLSYSGRSQLGIEMTELSKQGYEFIHSNSSYVIMAKQI